MNNRHPQQLNNSKPRGPFWSCKLKSTANSAHLAYFCGEQAELAVLVNRQLQNRPQNFVFFQLPWVLIIHLSLFLWSIECPNIGHNRIFLGSVDTYHPYGFWLEQKLVDLLLTKSRGLPSHPSSLLHIFRPPYGPVVRFPLLAAFSVGCSCYLIGEEGTQKVTLKMEFQLLYFDPYYCSGKQNPESIPNLFFRSL